MTSASSAALPTRPVIRKLGTIDGDMVETTPVVFKERLYRFEYVRPHHRTSIKSISYFRFVDAATGRPTAPFAEGMHLGSAHVEGDTVFVYGVEKWGACRIHVFRSQDLVNWSSGIALDLPGWEIFNTSVCGAGDRYVMAFEISGPPEECGVRFTMQFAESTDLLRWRRMENRAYSKERYTACPALRFLDGQFYMIYLECKPGRIFEPHIARSRTLQYWEQSPFNPFLSVSPEDKSCGNPDLDEETRRRIASAPNCNNSDVDLCEFNGKVIIYYAWGNQLGTEFLAEAVYDGTLRDLFLGFFPDA